MFGPGLQNQTHVSWYFILLQLLHRPRTWRGKRGQERREGSGEERGVRRGERGQEGREGSGGERGVRRGERGQMLEETGSSLTDTLAKRHVRRPIQVERVECRV
jgi:hypothetical protein